jgi:hypothetical protein
VVDSREGYPFTSQDQQVVTRRAALVAGDYGLLVAGALPARPVPPPDQEPGGALAVDALASARPLAPPEPTPADIRAWAPAQGIAVSDRARPGRPRLG